MRLGMVDLDTSHPRSWLRVLREMGHDVVCVFDGGTVYPEGYAQEFAREMNVQAVCTSPEEMVGKVDAAIIHSCNWDLHVKRARPFVEADVPVLIDKPIVGNVRDAHVLMGWAEEGKVVTGGSSLRHCYETQEFLAKPPEETGRVHAGFAGCGVDEFNYGIHAFSNLFGLMGVGCRQVRWLGTYVQDQYELTWEDGRRGIVTVGQTETWLPSYATVVTARKVVQFQPDTTRIYRALLEHELPILARQRPPVPTGELLEPELSAIAGLVSKRSGGEPVRLGEKGVRTLLPVGPEGAPHKRVLTPFSPGYDGRAFARGYREKQLPKYLESRKR